MGEVEDSKILEVGDPPLSEAEDVHTITNVGSAHQHRNGGTKRHNVCCTFGRKKKHKRSLRMDKHNIPRYYSTDWFYSILVLPVCAQVFILLIFYFVTVLTFALLYFFAGPENLRGFESNGDFVWLSVQTLTTVGYGRLEPLSIYAQLVATIESFFGIMFLACCSGIIWFALSKPTTCILFSNICVIEPLSIFTEGASRLHFRALNVRRNLLYDVQAHVRILYREPDPVNGGIIYRRVMLKLEKEGYNPRIETGTSFFHCIDESSPLCRKDLSWMIKHEARIVAVMTCYDNAYKTTTAISKIYNWEDVQFHHLFLNLITKDEATGEEILDFQNFHKSVDVLTPLRNLFDKMDKNSDGEVSLDGIKAFLSQENCSDVLPLTVSVEQVLAHFSELDENRSGGLSWEEFKHGFCYLRLDVHDDIDVDDEISGS